MLKMSAGIAWVLGAALEWLMALGYDTEPFRLPEALLWMWVAVFLALELILSRPRSGRLETALSAVGLGLYLWRLKGIELWYAMPADYGRSRRAELFSAEFRGIPWGLLGVALLLTPSALMLSKWLRSEGAPGDLLGSFAGPSIAFLYWGVTLLVCLRYGAGQLLP
jgi:hypothetical protein